MKTLFLFTLTVILSLSLSARENPFTATNAYEEEAARIIELNEVDETAYGEEQFIQQMQEEMAMTKELPQDGNKNKVKEAVNKLMPSLKEKKINDKVYSQKEVKKLIKKAQKQTEAKTKKLIKTELEKSQMVEPQQVVFVKPRPDVEIEEEMMKTKKVLPFMDIEYSDDKLIIHTKYKVSKKFTLNKGNKIIIDYKAKLNFYTKRESLDTSNYKKVAIGNHKKNGFFRVVVELNSKPSNFKVNYKNNLISIVKINEL